jgi:hypothetical protein
MLTAERVQYLGGSATTVDAELHPVIHLTDEELRRVIGGIEAQMASSSMTGSYNASAPAACCDGTKTCCCIC